MELREELKKTKAEMRKSEREKAVAMADLNKLAPPGVTAEVMLVQGNYFPHSHI